MFGVCGFNASCRSYFASRLSLAGTSYTSLYMGTYNLIPGVNRFPLANSIYAISGSMFYVEMNPGLQLSLVSNATNIDYEVLADSSLSPLFDQWGQRKRFNFKFRFEGVFYVIYEFIYKAYNTSGSYNLVVNYPDFGRNTTKVMNIQDCKLKLLFERPL